MDGAVVSTTQDYKAAFSCFMAAVGGRATYHRGSEEELRARSRLATHCDVCVTRIGSSGIIGHHGAGCAGSFSRYSRRQIAAPEAWAQAM